MSGPQYPETAADVNRRLRAERATDQPVSGEPGQPGYAQDLLLSGSIATHRERLSTGWMLDDAPTIADLPLIGGLSRVPLLGGLLAFGREVLGLFWLLLHRRSPYAQQVRFNRAAADALSLLDLELQLDSELQRLRKDLRTLDARSALDSERLENRLNGLAGELRTLADEVRTLREAVERAGANRA